jgi:ABC-type multidrug transport system fused ATPase/permease subunit
VAGYSIHWLGKALKRTHRKAMQELSMIYETLSETLGGIKLIKAFTMEPSERNKFEKSAKEYYRRQMRIAMYNSLVNPVVESLGISRAMSLMGLLVSVVRYFVAIRATRAGSSG